MEVEDLNVPVLMVKILATSLMAAVTTIILRDVSWYFFNQPTRDQTKTTKNCYDWFEHYLPVTTGEVIDYSEGVFDFNQQPPMTLQAATTEKYRYIYEKLGLAPGMLLLDAGCGNGEWMRYCRSRGVNAIGLTLSPEQAKAVRAKELTVDVRDYRLENPAFIGMFDRITALGSTEHVSSSMGSFANGAARERCSNTLIDIWTLFQRYLKPDGKIFITVVTINEQVKWSLRDTFQAYVLDQHYGGYYPRMSDIQTKVAPAAGLTVTDVQDHTANYHWSSMVEPKHFGYFKINWKENTSDKIWYIFASLVKSPLQFPFHWLYQAMDTWMWQFGGPTTQPLTPEQVAKAPMQLKYFMLQATRLRLIHKTPRRVGKVKRTHQRSMKLGGHVAHAPLPTLHFIYT